MSTPPDRRARKRIATRQAISDVATQLFHERGFDQVTVDEIARAADVSRMTVFNHFPRKEDMFFDLDEQVRAHLLEALQQREAGVAPLEALRLFAQRAIEERRPYAQFSRLSQSFVATMEASIALQARARAIRDELAQLVAAGLAAAVGRAADDAEAQLVAGLLLATWAVALVQAHRAYRRRQSGKDARALFLRLAEQGTLGLKAMMAGTPYA